MGQAKIRGSQADRAQQAADRATALRPRMIQCNQCQNEINEIIDMDTRGMVGIDGVFSATCPDCNSTTFAFRGKPEAVAKLAIVMNEEMGGNLIAGSQKIT